MHQKLTLSLTALLTIIMLTAGGVAAQGNAASPAGQTGAANSQAQSGAADTADVEFTLVSPEEATVTVRQEWQGQKAHSMRQSLDAFFGAGDGNLTADEVDRIERASEDDVRNRTLPLFFMDGNPMNVTEVRLEIENASGPVSSTQPLTMQHELRLAIQAAPDAQEYTLRVSPLWPGEIRVTAPAGWHIAEDEGLQGSPGANATGVFVAGQDRTVTFVEGEPPMEGGLEASPDNASGNGEPQESTGGARPGERPATIPGPAGILTFVALAAAAGLAIVLRRRKDA